MNDKSSLMDEIAQIRDEKRLLEIYRNNDDIDIRYAIVNLIDDDEILHKIFTIEKDDFIKSIALERISADIIGYDDFNALDDYEKISFIEEHDNESLLESILEKDENFQIRIAAVHRIHDMDFLSEIAPSHDDYDTRIVIYKKLAGKSILDEIMGEKTPESRLTLVGDLNNNEFLKDIAVNDPDESVRKASLERIEDADDWAYIAKNAVYGNVCLAAVGMIDDEGILVDIAKNASYSDARRAAVGKITDENVLAYAARNSSDGGVRREAVKRISDDNILADVLANERDAGVRFEAVGRISDKDVLVDVLRNDPKGQVRREAVRRVSDEVILAEASKNDKDEEVRLEAVEKISDGDILADIAKNATYGDVRREAVAKITDEDVLIDVSKNDPKAKVRIEAVRKVMDEDVLEDILRNDSDAEIRFEAAKKVTDEDTLVYALQNDPYWRVRLEAVGKISDDDALAGVLKDEENITIRIEAVKRIGDEDILTDIARNDPKNDIRVIAVQKITDEDVLSDILINDSYWKVCREAVKKVSDEEVLAEALRKDLDYEVCLEAIKKINDEDALAYAARNSCYTDVPLEAIKKISDEDVLEDVARNNPDFEVKCEALKKLNKPHYYSSILNDDSKDWGIEDESQLMEIAFFYSSNQLLVEKAVNNIANPSFLFELCRSDNSIIREAAFKKLILGNIFSTEKIADKISFDYGNSGEDDFEYAAINSPNWRVRRDAVSKITDEDVLIEIARNDDYSDVRRAAVKRIADEDVLIDILRNDSSSDVRRDAVSKITDEDVLLEVLKNDSYGSVRRAAVGNIVNEDVLLDILSSDYSSDVRSVAVEKIDDEAILIDVLRHDSDVDVRRAAVKRITDEDVLIDILRNDPSWKVRSEAVRSISDNDVLVDVFRQDSSFAVRHAVVENITDKEFLVEIARDGSQDYDVRRGAIKNIADKVVLEDIARNETNDEVRLAAVEKITDSDVLLDIFANDSFYYVRKAALENINDEKVLQRLLIENYGYFSISSFSAFKRNYNNMIYESIGTEIYEDILDRISDESLLAGLMHERLFGDFRVLIARRLTSPDELKNLALNDLDYRVRLSAVKNPNLCDEKTFMRIFESDYNDAVRLEALKRIEDADTLKCAANDLNPLVRFHAYERLGWDFDLKKTDIEYENINSVPLDEIADENILYQVAINDSSPSVRRQAFEKITDELILFNLVLHNIQFAHDAFKRISDKNLLLNIALYASDKSLARKAVKRIDDDEFLLQAVQNNPYNDISAYIVGRFRDESLLEIIALNNSNPFNRKVAVNKIRSLDILIRLGHVECEEVVCTAIVRKCRDNDLLEYIGLSNPCKTVRRYVESVVDDDELLYRFALKEYENDNRRDVIFKIRNERYVANLLKRESSESVIKSNFVITDEDLLMDLFENSYSFEAKICAIANMSDKSFLKDLVYASPFVSQKHENDDVREDPGRDYGNLMIVFTILNGPYFDDMKCIEEFLIQNNLHMCRELFDIREKIADFSSMYRIALNCKSQHVRRLFRDKLKYDVEYVVDDDSEEDGREEPALSGLAALFG